MAHKSTSYLKELCTVAFNGGIGGLGNQFQMVVRWEVEISNFFSLQGVN